jgi:hypothetical protein
MQGTQEEQGTQARAAAEVAVAVALVDILRGILIPQLPEIQQGRPRTPVHPILQLPVIPIHKLIMMGVPEVLAVVLVVAVVAAVPEAPVLTLRVAPEAQEMRGPQETLEMQEAALGPADRVVRVVQGTRGQTLIIVTLLMTELMEEPLLVLQWALQGDK